MANIFDGFIRSVGTITSPVSNFLNGLLRPNGYVTTSPSSPVQQYNNTQPQNARAQLMQVDSAYNQKWVSGMSESEVQSRLQKYYDNQQKQAEHKAGEAAYQNMLIAREATYQSVRVKNDAEMEKMIAWEQRQKELLNQQYPGFTIKYQ